MFRNVDEPLAWSEVDKARQHLSAYLGSLDEEDWNHQSLCEGWLVRDVVAHLILEYHYTSRNSYKDLIRSKFQINSFLRETAINLGKVPIPKLLARFDDLAGDRHKPASGSVLNVLVDLLVHEQDIRIPLGHASSMPQPALQLIFEYWEPGRFNLGERLAGLPKVIGGLEFVATDIAFHSGEGERVEGKAQDILLGAVGRKVALKGLAGPGVVMLEDRLN